MGAGGKGEDGRVGRRGVLRKRGRWTGGAGAWVAKHEFVG